MTSRERVNEREKKREREREREHSILNFSITNKLIIETKLLHSLKLY